MRTQLQVQNNFQKQAGLGKGKCVEPTGLGMGYKSMEEEEKPQGVKEHTIIQREELKDFD